MKCVLHINGFSGPCPRVRSNRRVRSRGARTYHIWSTRIVGQYFAILSESSEDQKLILSKMDKEDYRIILGGSNLKVGILFNEISM